MAGDGWGDAVDPFDEVYARELVRGALRRAPRGDQSGSGAPGGASPKVPRRRRRGLALVLGVILGGTALLSRLEPQTVSSSGVVYGWDGSGKAVVLEHPPRGVGEQTQPLGEPASAPGGRGPYRFMETQPGSSSPVAYDPCRLIHVVLNDRTAPPGADLMVRAALERASAISGIQFVIDGHTNEVPSQQRQVYLPSRYPGRWAPVLIAWSDTRETPRLTGEAGLGGSTSVAIDGHYVYVSGTVTLNGPVLYEVLGRVDGAALVQAVIEHEVGHLLGLAHVHDPAQLMFSGSAKVLDYATGDQLGLEALGRGRCFPDL
jgi:hypothetical protein